MKIKLVLLAFSCLFISQAVAFPEQNNVPGGIALVHIMSDKKPELFYRGNKVLVSTQNGQLLAVVGISLNAKVGSHFLLNKKTGNKIHFTVNDKDYPAQHITIKNKRHVNPNPLDMTRIKRERKKLSEALAIHSKQAVKLDFVLPVEGRLSSPFGLKRFFNEQARRPHSGLDIAAPKGTIIDAPAGAVVIDTGNYFFNGNTILLDHGNGLISGYFHLNKIKVKTGDIVKQGQTIGFVGSTGRATGPHLHWNIYLNTNKIDPALFISNDMQLLKTTKPTS